MNIQLTLSLTPAEARRVIDFLESPTHEVRVVSVPVPTLDVPVTPPPPPPPAPISAPPVKRGPGRPRKDGGVPSPTLASIQPVPETAKVAPPEPKVDYAAVRTECVALLQAACKPESIGKDGAFAILQSLGAKKLGEVPDGKLGELKSLLTDAMGEVAVPADNDMFGG